MLLLAGSILISLAKRQKLDPFYETSHFQTYFKLDPYVNLTVSFCIEYFVSSVYRCFNVYIGVLIRK